MWHYETKAGTFYIVEKHQGFHVFFEDEDLGCYASPHQALDDLVGGHTYSPSSGVDPEKLNIPDDLSFWSFSAVRM